MARKTRFQEGYEAGWKAGTKIAFEAMRGWINTRLNMAGIEQPWPVKTAPKQPPLDADDVVWEPVRLDNIHALFVNGQEFSPVTHGFET